MLDIARLHGFAWGASDCDTWKLYRHDGSVVAVVRRAEDGDCWWVARPRVYPEPPVEPLAAAQRRAVDLALCAPLPDSKRKQVATNPFSSRPNKPHLPQMRCGRARRHSGAVCCQ
jgi:hypothetical protein